MLCKGCDSETGDKTCLQLTTKLYEAEIRVDIILSFEWLVTFNLNLKSREYGLETNIDPKYFIPGIKGNLEVVDTSEGSDSDEGVDEVKGFKVMGSVDQVEPDPQAPFVEEVYKNC